MGASQTRSSGTTSASAASTRRSTTRRSAASSAPCRSPRTTAWRTSGTTWGRSRSASAISGSRTRRSRSRSLDANHAESFNNLGILELRKVNFDMARNNFTTAATAAPFMHEALYNGALLAFKLGEFQNSYSLVGKALEAYPEHAESLELRKLLRSNFNVY